MALPEGATIEVTQGVLLLTDAGETYPLVARLVDADGWKCGDVGLLARYRPQTRPLKGVRI